VCYWHFCHRHILGLSKVKDEYRAAGLRLKKVCQSFAEQLLGMESNSRHS
jgi:hypothetical protein